MALKNDLIDIALIDLKAAFVLYDKKLYAQSFFLFQQASEKANKAFGLSTGLITDKKSIEIGHDQLKIQKIAVDSQLSEIKKVFKFLSRNPRIAKHELIKKIDFKSYHEELKRGLIFFDSIKKHELKIHTKLDLNIYLDLIEDVYNFKLSLKKKSKDLFFQELNKFSEFIKTFGSEKAKEDFFKAIDCNDDAQILILERILNDIFKILFIFITFYVCAFLTLSHSTLPRYPDSNNNPLKFYKKSNPIVKYQPYYMEYLKKAILMLKKYESI